MFRAYFKGKVRPILYTPKKCDTQGIKGFYKIIKDDDLNKMLEITHFKKPQERKYDLHFLQLEILDIYAIL